MSFWRTSTLSTITESTTTSLGEGDTVVEETLVEGDDEVFLEEHQDMMVSDDVSLLSDDIITWMLDQEQMILSPGVRCTVRGTRCTLSAVPSQIEHPVYDGDPWIFPTRSISGASLSLNH